MWKRLFPTRWLRITSWTMAALAWATTGLIAQNASQAPEPVQSLPLPDPVVVPVVTTVPAPLPAAPDGGLVILRYTPVPPPPPQEIVRTVVVGRAAPSSQAPTVSSAAS